MKRKSLKLVLKKTKIVSLTTLSQLYGGTDEPIQTNANDPNATCGECDETGTNDNPNTDDGVPTIGKKKPPKEIPPVATVSCDPCI